MSTGTVKWFSSKKGYGFITMEDGQEVFVHYTSIDGNGFRSLEQGEEVQFEVAQGPKGLQAAKVLRISIRTLRNKINKYSSEGIRVPPSHYQQIFG